MGFWHFHRVRLLMGYLPILEHTRSLPVRLALGHPQRDIVKDESQGPWMEKLP